MSFSSPASVLEVEMRPGRPPVLCVDTPADATGWAAEHREALRARVAEHGALFVRGLGLAEAEQISAVFTELAGP